MTKAWFKTKKYGPGWYPATWQGWLVLLAYLIILIALIYVFKTNIEKYLGFCFVAVFVLTGLLIYISYKKGESIYLWDGKDKDNLMKIKIFIENQADSDQKNIYNEKTLEYRKTVTISQKYPYPYGFILNTTSGDGDNLDVFVITDQKLEKGQIIEGAPIALMEQFEITQNDSGDSIKEEDHNVITVPDGETIVLTKDIEEKLRRFVLHAFDCLPHKKSEVGNFLDKNSAEKYIKNCLD